VSSDYDAIIIGGGFFGCSLALCLSSISDRILVLEAEDELMSRASRVNQARIHTGFHYPRSFTTALRSRYLQSQFAVDFPHAVVDNFEMLYAIAARRSRVSASRFFHTFKSLDAPFARASARHLALFDGALIEDVFLCAEYAFNYALLREGLRDRLRRRGIQVWTGTQVEAITQRADVSAVTIANGRTLTAARIFNITYSNINHLLMKSGIAPISLKHEMAEIALVCPPPDLKNLAVTIMDGPFFSSMPYPSEQLYSLTHVRYTPHFSWGDDGHGRSPYDILNALPQMTRWRHMMQDASRYMPCMSEIEYRQSLFDVKTVLVRNEADDGRPILLHRHPEQPDVISIMGGKIDNIYDLIDVLPQVDPMWRNMSHRPLID
jgi:glycine/D-amino acid oxidase-like deaminating enzyme